MTDYCGMMLYNYENCISISVNECYNRWQQCLNLNIKAYLNLLQIYKEKCTKHQVMNISCRSTKRGEKKDTACFWHVLRNDMTDKYWLHFHHNHIQVTRWVSFLANSGYRCTCFQVHNLILVITCTLLPTASDNFYSGEIRLRAKGGNEVFSYDVVFSCNLNISEYCKCFGLLWQMQGSLQMFKYIYTNLQMGESQCEWLSLIWTQPQEW